jgi:very-short-patch-repair endonuclease
MARAHLPLGMQCRLMGLPEPEPEYRFALFLSMEELAAIGQTKPRRWALDWAFPDQRLALEVEGGYAIGGRHTSAKGFLGDQEKYNALACLGWRLLRVTPRDVASGVAVGWIQRALKG